LRSPPESVFFTAVPTTLARRSLRPSSVSLPSMRRARSRRERCGARWRGEAHVFLDGQVIVEGVVLRDVGDEALELFVVARRATGR
jgi:hypothetical protein